MSANQRTEVEEVLAGRRPYDTVMEPVQALVRARWDEAIAADMAALNFEREFEAAGEWPVVGDSSGQVRIRTSTAPKD